MSFSAGGDGGETEGVVKRQEEGGGETEKKRVVDKVR